MRQAWPNVATPPAILTIVSLPRSWRRTGTPRSGGSGIWETRQLAERPPHVKVDPSAFTNLADNLSAAWNAPGAMMRARQQLLRTLITEIVVDVDDDARDVVLTIHWRGGQHSERRVHKPRTGEHGSQRPKMLLAVIRSMAGRGLTNIPPRHSIE
jgi:hypothetical protein